MLASQWVAGTGATREGRRDDAKNVTRSRLCSVNTLSFVTLLSVILPSVSQRVNQPAWVKRQKVYSEEESAHSRVSSPRRSENGSLSEKHSDQIAIAEDAVNVCEAHGIRPIASGLDAVVVRMKTSP